MESVYLSALSCHSVDGKISCRTFSPSRKILHSTWVDALLAATHNSLNRSRNVFARREAGALRSCAQQTRFAIKRIKGEYKNCSMTASPTLERPLPQNLEAERSILGAILLDN